MDLSLIHILHSIVSAYRAQLDDILAGREISDETAQARYRQLKRCFNRDFTSEYQDCLLYTSPVEMWATP